MIPKSLDPERLLGLAAPGDLTIGEMRASAYRSAYWKVFQRVAPRARLNFILDDGSRAPDTMTLHEMRRRVKDGSLSISIDDGEGGALVT